MKCDICNEEFATVYDNVPILSTSKNGEKTNPYISYERMCLCDFCLPEVEEQFYTLSQLQNASLITASEYMGVKRFKSDKVFDFKIDNHRDIFTAPTP